MTRQFFKAIAHGSFVAAFITVSMPTQAQSTGRQPGPDPQDTEVLTPVRQTTGRMLLNRLSFIRDGRGGYTYRIDQVCDKTFNADVFDGRGKSTFSWKVATVVSCDSDIRGKKVVVEGNGAVVIRSQGVFPGEAPSAIRSNSFGLQVVEAGRAYGARQIGSADVWSRDIGSSAILSLGEATPWDCDPKGICGPVETDIFQATVEFGQ